MSKNKAHTFPFIFYLETMVGLQEKLVEQDFSKADHNEKTR